MERDIKGRFTTGNQIAKGRKHTFKPRKTHNSYKMFSDMLLQNLSESEILEKFNNIPTEQSLNVFLKMLEFQLKYNSTDEIEEQPIKKPTIITLSLPPDDE